MGWANALCYSPAPPRWLLPPASSDLPSLPPMPPVSVWPGGGQWGGLGGQGTGLGAQQAPQARVGGANALRSSPAPPTCLSWSPWPQRHWSCLDSTSPPPPQSPHILPVHLGVPPVSLGVRVPQQQLAGALVVGRC